jgi:hypothetical protein
MKKYIILKEFADKNNLRKQYKPGDELPDTFDEARIANIVKLGLAKVKETEPGNGNDKGNGSSVGTGKTVTDIDLTQNTATILPQIKGFADIEKLKQYLTTEQSAEKPRQTVVKAIEDRIANIVKE